MLCMDNALQQSAEVAFAEPEASKSALGRHVFPNRDDAMSIRFGQCCLAQPNGKAAAVRPAGVIFTELKLKGALVLDLARRERGFFAQAFCQKKGVR